MSEEQWPEPAGSAPRPALPSLDELPRAGKGYDPERVEEAFDAFYRHIARLDATLQTLETAAAFSRQAADLRAELRAFRRARWEQDWASAYGRPTLGAAPRIASALPRIATEVAFLIAVAVFLGVGGFRATTIVIVMAAAWLIVGIVEWLARDRTPSFAGRPAPLAAVAQPDVPGWPDEPSPDDGLTMVAELEPSRRRWFRRGAESAAGN
jgi:hypothetical protein